MQILNVTGLKKVYTTRFGGSQVTALRQVDFSVEEGEYVAIMGESGSGKTTIGRAICRINPTSGGDIFFKGQKINGKIPRALDKQITREIQMIFQDPQSSLNERAKVSYIVGEGLMNVRPPQAADPDFLRVQDAYLQAERYESFLRTRQGQKLLFLELGVGYNTPVIIKYPFWRMTAANPRAVYACLNLGQAAAPREIQKQSICIDGDIGAVLAALKD